MGVPESIVQNGPEYVTQESLVNEIRAIRHDVTYLQRLHKAQVTYLDESTLKSETELSMLRNVVGGLSRALFDAGITNEDIAASTFGQSQPTMIEDESAVVGFAEQGMVVDKPMISADFVINDGTNAPSKLNSSPDSHLASEARMAELNDGDSASLDLSSKRRSSAGSITEPGHKHHEGILKSHQLKGLIAQVRFLHPLNSYSTRCKCPVCFRDCDFMTRFSSHTRTYTFLTKCVLCAGHRLQGGGRSSICRSDGERAGRCTDHAQVSTAPGCHLHSQTRDPFDWFKVTNQGQQEGFHHPHCPVGHQPRSWKDWYWHIVWCDGQGGGLHHGDGAKRARQGLWADQEGGSVVEVSFKGMICGS